MFFVFNPYNEKAKKRQGKFLNFDDHIKDWFNLSFKKYLNLLILRSITIILVLFFLVQLIAPVFKSFSVSAQGKLAANNPLDHWEVSDPGRQVVGIPFNINVTPKDSTDSIISNYDWTDSTNRPSFSGLSISLLNNVPVYNYQSSTAGVATYAVITYKAESGIQITVTGGQTLGAPSINPPTFDVTHADPTGIILTPNSQTVVAGTKVVYTANASDLFGNSWDVTSATIFSIIEEGHNGVWNDNIYTTHTSGKWTVQGVYSSFVDKVILNIVHTKAKSIEIIPRNYTTNSGQIINYNSKAKDKYNNFWESTLDTKFTISSEARGSWNANVYKSDKVGEWIVNGVYIPDPTITDTTFLDIKSKSIKSKSLSLSQQTQNIQGPITPIGEVGIASSIGPIGSNPEVLAESIVRPLPGFAELLLPSKFFSAAGLASQSVADWTSNLSILFIILGALMLLASFLGWYDFLSLPDKAIKKKIV